MLTPERKARRKRLWRLGNYLGVKLVTESVCRGHCAPMDFAEAWYYDRPDNSLILGPRGSGKSFIAAFVTGLDSISLERHETLILGGSEAQSQQIYHALNEFRSPPGTLSEHGLNLDSFTATTARFPDDSTVRYIAASTKSVRGPHVPAVRLDEVDEMDPDIRESAYGMCMDKHGHKATISMTSTWHRVGGPMAELLERGDAGQFPVFRYCIWEVLERCPEERSGPNLEKCPECPLFAMCHADAAEHGGAPKAKRSNGHYKIQALIQKLMGVSLRVFKSDYLCEGPKSAGVWFTEFDTATHVREAAEYDPRLPVHLAIDSGVYTGAVLFQVRRIPGPLDAWGNPGPVRQSASVFGDYLAEGKTAESNAVLIQELVRQLAGDVMERGRLRISTDSAGGARNPVGPTVIAEYERAGLRGSKGLERWPSYPGSVEDGLGLMEALVQSADGQINLTVHPRCKRTVDAFQGYARARRAAQWQDYPADPQHPHEDIIDSLRGGLKVEFPDSRKPEPKMGRVKAARIF